MCCTQLAENTGCKKSPKICHLGTITQLCRAVSLQIKHVSTIAKKNLLNSNISSRCPHNMANFGPLTAEIVSLVWGTPANFSGFHILSSLLQRCRSTEENQTLHAVWPSPGLVHYTFSGALAPGRNFARCKIHFTSKFCVLLYWQHCSTALQQRASAKLCGMVQGMELRNFCRRRYLYLPGQPSRWALSHILVKY